MSDSSDFRHLGASEFPNDNPLLHDGAVWVCFSPCGPLRPVVRPRAGVRASTIPAPAPIAQTAPPPVRKPEVIVPPAIEAPPPAEATVAPEAVMALPLPPLELEFTPNSVAEASVEEPLDLDPIAAVAPSGCSLTAGLEPLDEASEPPSPEVTVSELRERFHAEGAADVANDEADLEPHAATQQDLAPRVGDPEHPEVAPIALPPVDVECAPSEPTEETVAATDAGEPSERMTILPPPSEDGARTLTLTRIRVSGRSIEVTSEAAPPMDVASAEPVVAATPAETKDPAVTPREQDPFAAFVSALVEVAMIGGATRAAAVLPRLLDGKAEDLSGFTDAVLSSVVSAAIVSGEAGSYAPSAPFVATSNAWRMVLRGESNDFSACGTSTLDGWALDLLKAFGVGRDGKVDVRRELRRRGVAAFGMILAA